MQKVKVAGREVFPIGIGTGSIGERAEDCTQEVKTIQTALEHGLQVIDTAEMYAAGNSEKVIAQAIQPYRQQREELFLISKVLPENASKKQIPISLDASLKRLNVDYIDLYLLHWKGGIPLEETVEALEQARGTGKIKAWGVSNLDVDDMEKVIKLPSGTNCAANQVRYNLGDRGIEFDLVPMQQQFDMPIIAYSPIARGDSFGTNLTKQVVLQELAAKHEVDVFQILLAWSIRNGQTIAIPQTRNSSHVLNNMQAATIQLTAQDLAQIDSVFPAPTTKQPLALW